MISYEEYLSDSPDQNSKDLSEEEALNIMFPKLVNNREIKEDIDIDNLYCLNIDKSEDINNISKNESKEKNENALIILDDYESFFNKFADKNTVNGINPEEGGNENPCFSNLDNENELHFSLIEDEILIKIEIQNLKSKKDAKKKIFTHIKSKKKSEKKLSHPKFHRKSKNTKVDTKEKCFPFKSGRGIIFNSNPNCESLYPSIDNQGNICSSSRDSFSFYKKDFSPPDENDEEKINTEDNNNNSPGQSKEECKEDKSREDSDYNYKVNNLGDNFLFKFTTKKYFVAPNGKKKRVKKKRKFKPDDIRKKIKSRFHKTIKNIINENLKKAGSKELFDFLPQCFIGNVSKKTNSTCFELTYKELLSTNFLVELNKEGYRNSKVDINKYKKNLEVLNYLDKNPEICKRSGFDLIENRKYKELLTFYFASAQFENSLIQLKEEKESPEYIQEYINRARTYVSFYSNLKNDDDEENINKNEFK